MAIPSLWPDALRNARLCTSADARSNIRRISRSGEVALREACILFALSFCKGRADIGRIEKLTGINAASAFFTTDGLASRGYVTTEPGDFVYVTLTDTGRALLSGCCIS